MPEYITTYTGVHFYPMAPTAEDIRIEDIAHALPQLCRGNGHVKTFFSVGQHCIHCALEAEARGMSPVVTLGCLLHDAGECYMSDVPRPLKQFLPNYIEQEDRILDIIYRKFIGRTLTDAELSAIRIIDDDMLYYDLATLLNEPPNRPRPNMASSFSYEILPFSEVETRYLALFHRLTDTLNAQECINAVQESITY